MAIEVQKPIKDFIPSERKKYLAVVLIANLLMPIIITSILLIVQPSFDILTLLILDTSVYLAGSSISFLIFLASSGPFDDLLVTIMRITGEKSLKAPLMPNGPKYKSTGLETAVNSLYQLDVKTDSQTTSSAIALDKALDSTKSGFVIMKSGKIIYSNSAAPIYIDTDGNQHLKLLFKPNDTLESWLKQCQESSVSGEKIWTRIPNVLPEEENCKYYDVLATFSRDSDYEVVLTLIDRTSIYAVSEEALNFIAFAAHELRGPITVIKGYLDVLEDELGPTLDDDHNMLIGRLKVSANRLSTYINNILNTSRYDRRHLKLRLAEEKLVDVYDVIKEDMSLRASSQNRLLSVSILPNLPTIAADKNSLSEVFANLIDNAIKYSSEGGTISVEAVAKENNVEISVSDNGIGMPESVVENLFQKFFRSHRSREAVAGTGIGLYISKAIVESHGGKIKVDSIEGKGSKFTVILPVYSAVEKSLSQNKDSNENIISENKDQIKNHSMYRG